MCALSQSLPIKPSMTSFYIAIIIIMGLKATTTKSDDYLDFTIVIAASNEANLAVYIVGIFR